MALEIPFIHRIKEPTHFYLDMNINLISCTIVLILTIVNGAYSRTPHLNYRYSTFAVPNPTEAIEFLSKYVNGYILQPEEFLAKPLSPNPEQSEIRGIRIPYNGLYSKFADVYFVKETGLPENPELPLEDFIQRLEQVHTFSQVIFLINRIEK